MDSKIKWSYAARWAILIGMTLSAGCSSGMKMQRADYERVARGERELEGIRIRPITARLIVEQTQTREVFAANSPAESPASANAAYRVGPRDVLSITVWDHPELTIPAGEFRSADAAGHLVAEDGTIFYPEVGVVRVAGQTVGEIRTLLTQQLARTITNPQLDVRVAAFRSKRIYVTGEVENPGPQSVTDIPTHVVDAVNQAGGVTAAADMAGVTISRAGRVLNADLLALYEQGDLSQNLQLLDGDVLYVPDRTYQKVFVIGEVERPSAVQMRRGGRLTLAEALTEAGSIDRIAAKAGRVFVIRGTPSRPEIFHLDARSPDSLILGESFALDARDVVYVETTALARWDRVIAQLVPTTLALRNMSATDFPLFEGRGEGELR